MSEERSEERIQRIMARAGISSRRKAEELIRDGRVTVNGELAGIGDKADPGRDIIKVDGRRIQPHTGAFRYLLLNKPKAVMSTVTDPQGRQTVMDFVPPGMRKALVPVGRLDFDTEGLILLTDDGDFAQHVAHPRYGGTKTYEVKVKGEPAMEQIAKLRAGILLDGKMTAPARITSRATKSTGRKRRPDEGEGHNTWWVVELTEGRTRQIREMFLRIGHPVQKLRRVAIGPVKAPGLPIGSIRELTDKEVETLRKITARPKRREETVKRAGRPAKPAEEAATTDPTKPRKPSRIVPVKKKTAAKKASVDQAAAKKAPAEKAPAPKAAAKKAPAKKAPAKKAPAKRTTGARPAARKSAPAKRSGPGGGGERRGPGTGRGRRP